MFFPPGRRCRGSHTGEGIHEDHPGRKRHSLPGLPISARRPWVRELSGSAVVSGQGGAIVRGHAGHVAAHELAGTIPGCGLGAGRSGKRTCAACRVCQPSGVAGITPEQNPHGGGSEGRITPSRNEKDMLMVRIGYPRNRNIELIKEALEKESKVMLSGFGSYEVRYKPPRRGRNPQTGDKIILPARKVVKFKPSQLLRKAVNGQPVPIDSIPADNSD